MGTTIRAEIPLLNGHTPVHYLDSATASLIPRAVLSAWTRYFEEVAVSPMRSGHDLGLAASDALHEARTEVASFINASLSEVIFTSSATAALNMIGLMLELGADGREGQVVTNESEHYANLLQWMLRGSRPAIVRVGSTAEPTWEDYDAHLASARLATVAHVSHITGAVRDVRALAERCRRAGVMLAVDACQSIARVPIDVKELGCDFLVFSSQFALAPAGVGVLYVRREVLDQLAPPSLGAGNVHRVDAGGTFFTPTDSPWRFEPATPNIGGIVALRAGLSALRTAGMDAINANERALRARLIDTIRELPGARVLGPERADSIGIVSFASSSSRIASLDFLALALAERNRVQIRTGNLSGTPALLRLGVGEAARASTGPYTDAGDIEALGAALNAILPRFAVTA